MKSDPQVLWKEFVAAAAKVSRQLIRWNYSSTFRDGLPERLSQVSNPDPIIRDVQVAIGNLEMRYGKNLELVPPSGRYKPGKAMKRFHAAAKRMLPYLEAHPKSGIASERLRQAVTP